ncbi:hypothetical protein K8I31_12875 [bacterium]|nr:hypothetical protein [bacterium]
MANQKVMKKKGMWILPSWEQQVAHRTWTAAARLTTDFTNQVLERWIVDWIGKKTGKDLHLKFSALWSRQWGAPQISKIYLYLL